MNFTMNFSEGCFKLQYKYQIYELEYNIINNEYISQTYTLTLFLTHETC